MSHHGHINPSLSQPGTFINKPSDDILNIIKCHFAKEWNVKTELLIIDSIETYINNGVLSYYLEFSIDWDGSFDSYWGEITHAEVLEDMRDSKINLLIKK